MVCGRTASLSAILPQIRSKLDPSSSASRTLHWAETRGRKATCTPYKFSTTLRSLRCPNQVNERSGVGNCMAECIVVEIHVDVSPIAEISPDPLSFIRQFGFRIFRRKQVGPPVKSQVNEVGCQYILPRIPWRIGDAQSSLVPTEKSVGLFRKPGFVAKFEGQLYGLRLWSRPLRAPEKSCKLSPIARK